MSAYDYYDKKSMIYMFNKNRWINDKKTNSGTVTRVREPQKLMTRKHKRGAQ